MAAKRKKILGMPIGRREPSRASIVAKRGLTVVGVGAVAAVAAKVVPKQRNGGNPSAQARSARAKMQQRLKTGRIDLKAALEEAEHDDVLSRARVKVILQSLPGVGPQGAANAMEELGIDPNRRVGGLGSHQREQLIERFS